MLELFRPRVWGMELRHFLHACEDPYVADRTPNTDAGLIDMQNATAAKPFYKFVAGPSVGIRSSCLKLVRRTAREA